MGDCSMEEDEKEVVGVDRKKVFVAVGIDVEEGKSLLEWAIDRFKGRKICLVHVHRPRRPSGSVDWKFIAGKLKQLAITEQCEGEVKKLLNEYTSFLSAKGVDADTWWIEMDNVAKGIVKLIVQYNIKCLVMGAAAVLRNSKDLTKLLSKKAISVCEKAPPSCLIWFIFKGRVIHKRGNDHDQDVIELPNLPHVTPSESGVSISNSDVQQPGRTMNKQRSASFLQTEKVSAINFSIEPWRTWKRYRSTNTPILIVPQDEAPDLFNSSKSLLEELKAEPHRTEVPRPSEGALIGLKSADTLNPLNKEQKEELNMTEEPLPLDEALIGCKSAETLESFNKAEEFERMWAMELNRKHELEKVLVKTRREIVEIKNQHNEHLKQIQLIREETPSLEGQLVESNDEVEERQDKMNTAVELLISFKGRRDRLREEYGNIIRELRKLQNIVTGYALGLERHPTLTTTFSEISDATQNFNPDRKLGEGRNGSVYIGFHGHITVAIKMLPDYGSMDCVRFMKEVEEISKVRHPHLVTLVGSCPDSRSLIYEYVENGNLEDCLACKGKTPPVSWKTRVRIAMEICSVLIFLHLNKPQILHGNLKPSNVLLGAGFVSKISDLGVSRLVQQTENLADPHLASEYSDPEFLETGELSAQSDIYSFGVILLRLLTGMQGSGVLKHVTRALEKGNIELVVDASAGNWPAEVTEQLLYLALRCCENKGSDRADLTSEVWNTLEQMRNSSKSITASRMSKENRRPPSHFVCPIYQDVFENPKIAADGYTYEGEAIEGWINSGHNTSPMTNLKLDHTTLIPNHALHYAIQEWQHKF